MSNQEVKSIVFLAVSLITFVIYGLIVYNGYQNGSYDTSNLLQFYARVILIYVPITIVLRILAAILFAIFAAIFSEIKGEELEDIDLVDERAQLIELKTMRISMIIFAIGFIWGLAFLAFGFSAHYFFLTVIFVGVLAELAETALALVYHRKGVSHG